MSKKRKVLERSTATAFVTSANGTKKQKSTFIPPSLTAAPQEIINPSILGEGACKEATPSPSAERYIVFSSLACHPDDFHSYSGPPETNFYQIFKSKRAANAFVNEMFYDKNPWGVAEFDGDLVEEGYQDGLLSLSIVQESGEEWAVKAEGTSLVTSEDKHTDRQSFTAQSEQGSGRTTLSHAKQSTSSQFTPAKQYVVYSRCEYIEGDGFHTCDGPGEPTIDGAFTSKDDANRRALLREEPVGS